MFNFDFDTLICTFKDGTQIAYINSVFDLTSEQKEEMQQYISTLTPKTLTEKPYQLKLTDSQKQKLSDMHDAILKSFVMLYHKKPSIELFTDYVEIEIHNKFSQKKNTPDNQRTIDLTNLRVGDVVTSKDEVYHRFFTSLSDKISETQLSIRVDDNELAKLYAVIVLVYKN